MFQHTEINAIFALSYIKMCHFTLKCTLLNDTFNCLTVHVFSFGLCNNGDASLKVKPYKDALMCHSFRL